MTIREARELRGLSQVSLARDAQIARTHLIRLEQQETPRLTLATLSKIARALNIPPSLLIDQGSVE